VFAADVHSSSGALLIVKGTPITALVLERLRNIAEGVGVKSRCGSGARHPGLIWRDRAPGHRGSPHSRVSREPPRSTQPRR